MERREAQVGRDGAAALLQQAHGLIDARRNGDAVELLRRALAIDPGSYRALCLLAQALYGMGSHQEALDAGDCAVAARPNDEWGHRLRSLALRGLGRAGEAVTAAEEAVRLAPNEPRAYQALTNAALDASLMSTARMAATHCVRLAPDQGYAWGGLGRLQLMEAKPREAEQHFARAVSLDPADAVLLNNLGVAQLRQGRWRPALASFAHSVRTDPSFQLPVDNIVSVMRSVPRSRRGIPKEARVFVVMPYIGAVLVATALLVLLAERGWRWAALHRELKRALPAPAIRMLDTRVRAAVPLWPPVTGVLIGALVCGGEWLQLFESHGSDVPLRLFFGSFGAVLFAVNLVVSLRRLSARRLRRAMAR